MYLDLHTLFKLVLVFYLNSQFSLAQERFEPTKLLEDSFIIDGLLDEEAWKNATLVTIENEIRPGNNTAARVETRGLITYTNTHFFIGFHALDNPENIRAVSYTHLTLPTKRIV